jgi:hypothetical protein
VQTGQQHSSSFPLSSPHPPPTVTHPVENLCAINRPFKSQCFCHCWQPQAHSRQKFQSHTCIHPVLKNTTLILLSFERLLLCLQGYRVRNGCRT